MVSAEGQGGGEVGGGGCLPGSSKAAQDGVENGREMRIANIWHLV